MAQPRLVATGDSWIIRVTAAVMSLTEA
jgi:hypothetical protein